MINQDLLLIGYVWLVLLAVQILVGGLLMPHLQKVFVDGGWGFARLIGWLVVGLLVWWGAHLGLPVNSQGGVYGLVAVLLLWGGRNLFVKRKEIKKLIAERWRFILTEEVLFLVGLVGISIIRGFNPNILDLEKFMDAGFVQGYLRSPILPMEDMWLAGEKVNYYTFGHFLGNIMLRFLALDIGYGYNLLLGIVAGMVFSGSFAVVVNMIGKRKGAVVGGLVGAMLVGVGGNTHTLWYAVKNKGLAGYWYADATRFIENTIHEFPSYSFVVSDLHGHLWDLPVVLLFLLVLVGWLRSQKKGLGWWEVMLGLLLGVMVMTNTWDVLIYGLLLAVVGGFLLVGRKVKLVRLFLAAGVVLGVGVLVSAAWWLNFENIGQGVEVVIKASPWWKLLVLWGGQGVLVFGAGWFSFRLKRQRILIWGVALTALLLLAIPELVFVKDIYPNHPRANTMFKLTYQAFVLMGLLGGWLVGVLRSSGWLIRAIFLVVLGGLMLFPWFGYRGYYGNFANYQGLNGVAWLEQEAPDDWAAITWLKENVDGRPVVLEAVGESYTKFGRVSVFSGLPTVLGWRVHEWLWRGGFEIPAQRTEEVRLVYEKPLSVEAQEVLERYKVKYVFVGTKERETYKVNGEVEELGEVVFESGNTRVISVAED